jgi:F0F1-type ATP synthase, subunit a
VDVSVKGADILYTIPAFGGIPITTTLVNAWLVMVLITFFCIWLTHGMQVHAKTKRQHVAELLVTTVTKWITDNMGTQYTRSAFPPFIAALFALSVCSSLLGLFGLYPPTADLATTVAWSVMVFVMITYMKIKTNKLSGYLKGFTEPVKLLTPLNIVSELSTPLSMAFRHFGNIASGQVVGILIYMALLGLNQLIFGWLPGVLGEALSTIPFTYVGIPAILSIYFDVFSAFMQAFIFCMLTMNYISLAAEAD